MIAETPHFQQIQVLRRLYTYLRVCRKSSKCTQRRWNASPQPAYAIPLLSWLRSSFLNATGPSLECQAVVRGAIHRSHLEAPLTSSSTRTFPAKTVHIHNARWRCRSGVARARAPPPTGATYYYTITKIHLCPRNCRSS